jgi:hypothetical protein
MYESSVDHSIGSARALTQTLEVVERPTLHIGSRRAKRCSGSIRTSQPEHLMACADEFRNDCGANETRCPGDKDSHILSSR